MNKASGRAALILATGILACLAGPSPAAAAGQDSAAVSSKSDSAGSAPVSLSKYAKHRRHFAHRRSYKTAKSSAKEAEGDMAAPKAVSSNEMPPRVADANAQLAAADTPAAGAQASQTTADQAASNSPPAGQPGSNGQVVAADQLNDIDRALQQEPASAMPAVAQASTDAPAATDEPPARPAPVRAASSDSSAWDQTSLIGKIFIGFGVLLTLASTARMFMA